MRTFIMLLLLLSLGGCQGKLATKSGKPEVTISGVTKQKALDGIAAWAAMKGHSVSMSNEYGLTTQGDRKIGPFNAEVSVKSVYTVVGIGADVTIYDSQSQLVDDNTYEKGPDDSYAFKKVGKKDMALQSQGELERIQSELEELKDFIIKQ